MCVLRKDANGRQRERDREWGSKGRRAAARMAPTPAAGGGLRVAPPPPRPRAASAPHRPPALPRRAAVTVRGGPPRRPVPVRHVSHVPRSRCRTTAVLCSCRRVCRLATGGTAPTAACTGDAHRAATAVACAVAAPPATTTARTAAGSSFATCRATATENRAHHWRKKPRVLDATAILRERNVGVTSFPVQLALA